MVLELLHVDDNTMVFHGLLLLHLRTSKYDAIYAVAVLLQAWALLQSALYSWLLRNIHRNLVAMLFTCMTLASAGISHRRVSVHLDVFRSHAGIVSKRLNIGSRKQCHVIA